MSDWEITQYRPGQRIKLTDLSDDILTVLAQYISEQKFASTRYLLSECTQHFKQLAAPFLPLSYSEGENYPSQNTKLQLFLIEILARPEYARRIRTYQGHVMRFRDISTGIEEGALDVSMFTEVDWTRIRAAIRKLETDGERTTLWNVERGSWEAMTTLALSQLPYLEKLDFHGWSQCDENVPSLTAFLNKTAELQKEIQGSPSPLSVPLAHLSKVSVSYWDTEGGMGLEELELFMQLKSVETVFGHMIHGDEYFDEGTNFDPTEDLDNDPGPLITGEGKYPNILEIDLNYSSIEYRDVRQFLSECPNVRKFRYDDSGGVEGGADFFPARFMSALRQSRNSLQELNIEFSNPHEGDDFEYYPLGSFADFPRLKVINASACLLLGGLDAERLSELHPEDEFRYDDDSVDDRFPATLTLLKALPPNIEKLEMDCNVPAVEALISLLENIHEFPSLKHINIGWKRIVYFDNPLPRKPGEHDGFSPEEVDTLLDLCDAAGVTMDMHAM